jgi:thioredoxin-like negative regulator of GroEL
MTMPATTTISSAHAELGQATTALREGRFPDARKHAENALAAAEEPNALLVLGMACLRMGDLQAALVPLKRARELTPNRTAVHANLGDVLAHLGEVAEARASFRRAMELDPEHAAQYETRWVMMGRALHFQARGLGERMVHRDVASLLADVHSAVARDDLGHAFGTLALFGQQVLQHQLGSPMLANADLALGHREIDACIDALGARVLRERRPGAPRPRRPVTVHIATQLYAVGGHTRMLRAFIDADPGREQVVLLTDLAHDVRGRDTVASVFGERRVEWGPAGDQLHKLHWLMDRLEELAPERVILFQHHHDAVAVAACQPELAPDLYYYHHADYAFSFGVHHPRATHIDGSLMDFHGCRHNLGMPNNILVHFAAEDRPRNLAPLREGPRRLVTCTSATHTKLVRAGYRYAYFDLFPWLFEQAVDRHVHIGHLPEAMLNEIYRRLDAAGIARARFDYRGSVQSYWHTLVEAGVDVCIGSFPLGGGLTVTEAMGSGTPYVVHANYLQRIFTEHDMIYPEGFVWSDLAGLGAALKQLSDGACARHAVAARSHFERFHQLQQLRTALAGEHIQGAEASPVRPHRRDNLQIVLDAIYQPK